MKKSITLLFLFVAVVFTNAQNQINENSKRTKSTDLVVKKFPFEIKNGVVRDTILGDEIGRLKLYKKSVHASYYADKFNGKRTAGGTKFDNNDYTAAHKKLPFGTKLKITNEANGKFIFVEVQDRGPFVKSREIDLTKRAFMEIASNKGSGSMIVTIEEVIP